jgi:hypothetical protein
LLLAMALAFDALIERRAGVWQVVPSVVGHAA